MKLLTDDILAATRAMRQSPECIFAARPQPSARLPLHSKQAGGVWWATHRWLPCSLSLGHLRLVGSPPAFANPAANCHNAAAVLILVTSFPGIVPGSCFSGLLLCPLCCYPPYDLVEGASAFVGPLASSAACPTLGPSGRRHATTMPSAPNRRQASTAVSVEVEIDNGTGFQVQPHYLSLWIHLWLNPRWR